ncbi:MAG: hypothetical protein SCH66_12315, partial [Methanolobus sp.]|nr:hypothetical protein [Methanolobus sp.]
MTKKEQFDHPPKAALSFAAVPKTIALSTEDCCIERTGGRSLSFIFSEYAGFAGTLRDISSYSQFLTM